jgi:hypothetical protein
LKGKESKEDLMISVTAGPKNFLLITPIAFKY